MTRYLAYTTSLPPNSVQSLVLLVNPGNQFVFILCFLEELLETYVLMFTWVKEATGQYRDSRIDKCISCILFMYFNPTRLLKVLKGMDR